MRATSCLTFFPFFEKLLLKFRMAEREKGSRRKNKFPYFPPKNWVSCRKVATTYWENCILNCFLLSLPHFWLFCSHKKWNEKRLTLTAIKKTEENPQMLIKELSNFISFLWWNFKNLLKCFRVSQLRRLKCQVEIKLCEMKKILLRKRKKLN